MTDPHTPPLSEPLTEPLTLSFDVDCPVEHAFKVWTTDIGSWWPVDHTVSGDADTTVVLQSGVGGRIFERTAGGVELEWGEVTVWEPPNRLSYLWHIGSERAGATEVDIRFLPIGESTRVEIEHRGWQRLGRAADERRARNMGGWQALLPHYRTAVSRAATKGDS
jgi:uncharacterized protein YndB with AHSA1/START domain